MRRKRKVKRFDKFPEHPVKEERILQDTRNMAWMERFRDWHVKTVFYLALLGMTEQQIATVFEISVGQLNVWKKKYPTFLESLKKGREQADAQVVYSLYQLAIGYEHPSEQLFSVRDREYDPNTGKLVREKHRIIHEPIVKKYPPNAKAAIEWLRLRQPGQWSQRQDMTKTLNVVQTHKLQLEDLSVEELKLLTKLGVHGRDVQDVEYTDMQGFETTRQQEAKNLPN